MTAKKILLVHPTANQNVRETAQALIDHGLLDKLCTCAEWRRNGFMDRLLAFSPRTREELRRRSFAPALQPFVHTFGWREWGRQMSGHLGVRWLTQAETAPFSMDSVYRSLDRRVAHRLGRNKDIKAVYAYDGGALETFRSAKRHGIKCIYEHPIVYWRRVRDLQREEAESNPEWAPTLLALRDSEEKLAQKDEELALADVVVVACSFARDSLAAAPRVPSNVRVIPYGAPMIGGKPSPTHPDDRLRVLFVGALTQAKGLSYLLDAVARLDRHVALTLIGQRVSDTIPAQSVLDRHRWIPSLPHHRLLDEMGRHDVLVLPSLHEGFGLVILEAMAQGTPVIATSNTGGADLIEDGTDGFLIPIRSTDAIAEKLELLLGRPDYLADMREAARRKAQSCGWSFYRERVIALAREVIAN